MTPSRHYSYLEPPLPLVMAHRGGALEAPENSWDAFRHAVDGLGYRYLETDVRVTADGQVVTFHDATLDRTTNLTGPLSARSAAELSTAQIKGPNGLISVGVPLLADVLRTWPNLRVNLDAKSDDVVGPLGDLIDRLGALDRVGVGSFSEGRVDKLRQRFGASLCTFCGVSESTRLRAASLGLPMLGSVKGACLQVPVGQKILAGLRLPVIDGRLIAAAHRRDIPVIAWTIDARSEMIRLLDLGVDGLITDRPTVAKELLVELGRWVDG